MNPTFLSYQDFLALEIARAPSGQLPISYAPIPAYSYPFLLPRPAHTKAQLDALIIKRFESDIAGLQTNFSIVKWIETFHRDARIQDSRKDVKEAFLSVVAKVILDERGDLMRRIRFAYFSKLDVRTFFNFLLQIGNLGTVHIGITGDLHRFQPKDRSLVMLGKSSTKQKACNFQSYSIHDWFPMGVDSSIEEAFNNFFGVAQRQIAPAPVAPTTSSTVQRSIVEEREQKEESWQSKLRKWIGSSGPGNRQSEQATSMEQALSWNEASQGSSSQGPSTSVPQDPTGTRDQLQPSMPTIRAARKRTRQHSKPGVVLDCITLDASPEPKRGTSTSEDPDLFVSEISPGAQDEIQEGNFTEQPSTTVTEQPGHEHPTTSNDPEAHPALDYTVMNTPEYQMLRNVESQSQGIGHLISPPHEFIPKNGKSPAIRTFSDVHRIAEKLGQQLASTSGASENQMIDNPELEAVNDCQGLIPERAIGVSEELEIEPNTISLRTVREDQRLEPPSSVYFFLFWIFHFLNGFKSRNPTLKEFLERVWRQLREKLDELGSRIISDDEIHAQLRVTFTASIAEAKVPDGDFLILDDLIPAKKFLEGFKKVVCLMKMDSPKCEELEKEIDAEIRKIGEEKTLDTKRIPQIFASIFGIIF